MGRGGPKSDNRIVGKVLGQDEVVNIRGEGGEGQRRCGSGLRL